MRQIVSAGLVLALPVIDLLPVVVPDLNARLDPFGHASNRVQARLSPFSSGLTLFVAGVVRGSRSNGLAT